MAQEITLPNALRVRTELTDGVDRFVNTWHTPYQGDPISYDGVATAFRTFFSAISGLMDDGVTYDKITISRKPLLPGPWIQEYENSEAVVGSLANRLPPQCAMKVTLIPDKDTTESPRYGGPFIGPFGNTGVLSSNGEFTTATRDTVGNALVNLDSLLEASSGVWGLGVYWTRSLLDDVVRRVVNVRIGKTVDTQRRRRSEWPEAYNDYSLT